MKLILGLLLICSLIYETGCSKRADPVEALLNEGMALEAQRTAVLNNALSSLEFAREFEDIFVGGSSSVAKGRFGWTYDAEVGLYGRYIVEARLPITVDTNQFKVTAAGRPSIRVSELKRIDISSDGRSTGNFSTHQLELGAEEWQKLLLSHGNFSSVGFTMITNAPLKHFETICQFPGSIREASDPKERDEQLQPVHLFVSNSGSNDFSNVRIQMNSKACNFGYLPKNAAAYRLLPIPVGTVNIKTSWVEEKTATEKSASNRAPAGVSNASQIMVWEINISNGVVRASSRTSLAHETTESKK